MEALYPFPFVHKHQLSKFGKLNYPCCVCSKIDPEEDIELMAGDEITVPVIPHTVSVLGAVMNPTTIMYTSKGEPFFVDLEDFWKVKDICWHKNNSGYLLSYQGGKTTYLHRLVMDCPDELEVDHRYGSETKHDNRKYNLRICTRGENARNKEHKPKEDSCCIGVVKDKKTNKWVAQIGVNGKTIRLGRYVNLDDAIQARKEGEELYFGKWSYDNSRC